MTEQEIKRAMTLLDEFELSKMAEIRVGRWAVVNERGVYGIYDTKREAILDRLNCMGQDQKHSKVKRYGKGLYELAILDPYEDLERVYHRYDVYLITPANLLQTQEISIIPLLPEWYCDVYSEEYKEWNRKN